MSKNESNERRNGSERPLAPANERSADRAPQHGWIPIKRENRMPCALKVATGCRDPDFEMSDWL